MVRERRIAGECVFVTVIVVFYIYKKEAIIMETCFMGINQAATGARIRAIRKARGLKVTDISSYMGFESPQAVYKWQRGDSLPDLGNMIRLMELFQISDIREIVVTTGGADEALPLLCPIRSA